MSEVADVGEQLRAFRENGYVVLRGAIASPLLDDIRRDYLVHLRLKQQRMGLRPAGEHERQRDNPGVLADFQPVGGNHDLNRWNMHLPSVMPFLSPELIANPRALPLLHELLGRDCVVPVIASDTPFPNSGFQNAHQDSRFLKITINVALIDFTPENGPIEVWPRSHLPDPANPSTFTKGPFELSAEAMRRVVAQPSVPLLLRAGDMVVRDHRMVHRGSPNRSTEPRPMLSLYYQSAPERVPYRLVSDVVARASLATREAIRAQGVERVGPSKLEAANHVGRLVDSMSASDRDYRRVIPRTLWSDLPSEAQSLLRYARIEGGTPPVDARYSVRRSLILAGELVRSTSLLKLGIGALQRRLRDDAS